MRCARLLLLCSLLACAQAAAAASAQIPLRVPLELLRKALAEQLAVSPDRPGEIFRDGPCRYLSLGSPKLEAAGGLLRLTGAGKAAIGVELLGSCRNAADWVGTLQLDLAPTIDSGGRLRVRVVDSRLSDERDGTAAAGIVWDLAKKPVHASLERFGYDLGASRDALASMLRGAVPAEAAPAMEALLKGMEVLQPRVEAEDVVVPLAFAVPPAWAAGAAPQGPGAPLGEAEIDALEKAVEPWDAFLVYSLRQVALDGEDGALRKRLFTLLLESRYRLVALLSGEAPGREDPVRTLFLDAWSSLRSILADAEREHLLGASVARYALFVDAGDALVALQQAAPGLELSAEGLRRLARSLRPGEKADPLAYDWSVDPQLQRLFGVPGIEESPVPPARTSSLDPFLRAALDTGAPRLDRWVPGEAELDAYERKIGGLLDATAAREASAGGLAAPYDAIYDRLVPATALIESCWHQYVRRGGKVTVLRSAAGSVGIMQINQHVWRGFYDVRRLRTDTAYNVLAGAQILMRYVKDYAIPYAEERHDPQRVPRAAYAVYNAGPHAVGRFDKPRRPAREARVDAKLWSLYRGLAAGGQADLRSCRVKDADEPSL